MVYNASYGNKDTDNSKTSRPLTLSDVTMLLFYIILLGAGTLAWWFFSSYIRRRASKYF